MEHTCKKRLIRILTVFQSELFALHGNIHTVREAFCGKSRLEKLLFCIAVIHLIHLAYINLCI